jgi:hypothetical protein
MNAGFKYEQRAPIAAGQPLVVKARIENIDADERRAVITQRIVTGTKGAEDAVVADLFAYVPLGDPKKKTNGDGAKKNGAGKPQPRVPAGAFCTGSERWRAPSRRSSARASPAASRASPRSTHASPARSSCPRRSAST